LLLLSHFIEFYRIYLQLLFESYIAAFRLVSGSRSLGQFSSLERFTTVTLMLLFFWLNGLFITTMIAGRMTQIRYTRAQLIDLRICAGPAGPRLPSDVIARINTLMTRRRGCRARRKVKLKLQGRAVGVRYDNPDDMIDVADVGQQRQIPTLITNRTAVVVNINRSLARVHSSSPKRRRCVQRVARHNHSMQHHFTTKPPPTLYVFNSASLAKPHAIELLIVELTGYDIDIAVICETHLKKKRANSCVGVDGYILFRRDRVKRKGGGVAVYVRESLHDAVVWSPTPSTNPTFELLWVKVGHGHNMIFVGALYHPPAYHPPAPPYLTSDLMEHIESTVLQIQNDFPQAQIILAGDLNSLPDSELVVRTGLTSIVSQPTRGDRYLDRVYVSDLYYENIKVVKSTVKSDHMAIVAYTGHVKRTVTKTGCVRTFRKRTAAQHARFLADVNPLQVHTVCRSGTRRMNLTSSTLYCSHCWTSTTQSRLSPLHPPTHHTSRLQSNTCCGRRTS